MVLSWHANLNFIKCSNYPRSCCGIWSYQATLSYCLSLLLFVEWRIVLTLVTFLITLSNLWFIHLALWLIIICVVTLWPTRICSTIHPLIFLFSFFVWMPCFFPFPMVARVAQEYWTTAGVSLVVKGKATSKSTLTSREALITIRWWKVASDTTGSCLRNSKDH